MSKLFASLVVGLFALSLNAFAADNAKPMGTDCASLKPGPEKTACEKAAADKAAAAKAAAAKDAPAKK